MADAFTLDDLIAWGRDWEELLKESQPSRPDFFIPIPVLKQFLAAAIPALEEELERQTKSKVKPAQTGRPAGGGMGERVARLVANGIREEDAIAAVARQQHKPEANIRRAYNSVAKKPV
jgi:hypothetical protein